MATPPGRWLMVCLAFAGPGLAGDNRGIHDALALQEAVRQGRDLLTRGEPARAVELLEKQLGKVQGDPSFLALLRDAYQAYLKELQLAGKFETYELYRKRLAILDRPAAVKAAPKPEVVRGVRPEDDPFQQAPLESAGEVNATAAQADQAFAGRRYAEARELYSRAGPNLSAPHQSLHAYCILHGVVERLNAGAAPSPDLEKEVRAALAMAAKDTGLEKFGRQVLQQLRGPGDVQVRHGAAGAWKTAEGTNFRLFHNRPLEQAEQLVRLAEQYRTAARTKWGAGPSADWQPVCEMYLYERGEDYAKSTGQPATSPGHSSIKTQGGRVTARRIDLRGDNPELTGCVLPHEVTHVVLGDLSADAPLPRWADEGMAVLAEPRAQVERYLKTMIRLRQEGRLIPLAQIIGRPDYPDAATVTVFYVESVSVAEYLVGLKGAPAFVLFARDAGGGVEAALARHYGIRSVADLQDRWLRATFTEIDRQMGYGSR